MGTGQIYILLESWKRVKFTAFWNQGNRSKLAFWNHGNRSKLQLLKSWKQVKVTAFGIMETGQSYSLLESWKQRCVTITADLSPKPDQ